MEKISAMEESSTNRIEAFSDGVLAIVITLMVLEIKIPEMEENISSRDAFYQLLPILPKLSAYALSFIMIIIFWVNHHQLFLSIRVSTRALLWLNSFWLFWICLLPFATAFLGEYPFLLLGVLLFGFELFFCALLFYFIRRYCFQNNLHHSTVSSDDARRLARRSIFGPALYLLSVVLGFVSIYLSYAVFIIVPFLFIVSSLKSFKK